MDQVKFWLTMFVLVWNAIEILVPCATTSVCTLSVCGVNAADDPMFATMDEATPLVNTVTVTFVPEL